MTALSRGRHTRRPGWHRTIDRALPTIHIIAAVYSGAWLEAGYVFQAFLLAFTVGAVTLICWWHTA